MAARTGMAVPISELRQLTQSGTDEYTLGTEVYWSDNHLEDVLDSHKVQVVMVRMAKKPRYDGGTFEYFRYQMPPIIQMVEGSEAGTPVFEVRTSAGTLIGGTEYTFEERSNEIVFSSDRGGTDYYFTGFVYNMNRAAADVWNRKAASVYTAINFSADGARFDREKLHAHCIQMAGYFEGLEGMQSSEFVRTDMNPGPEDAGLF